MPLSVKRIPTGVSEFDTIIKGGLPSGSVVLLLGEVGAGQNEYVYTSASKLLMTKENPKLKDFLLGHACDLNALPNKLFYVTFSRSKEDILHEVEASFNVDYFETLKNDLIFKDFSDYYFKNSIVPSAWTLGGSNVLFEGKGSNPKLLESLVDFLDENAANNIVIIDSITDLVESEAIRLQDLVITLKGMQRMAKKWECLIYLILIKNIIERKWQQMLIDSVDGVITFEWSHSHRSSKRQRYMYVEKFMSILPHLDESKISRFATTVTAQSGLVVANTERI